MPYETRRVKCPVCGRIQEGIVMRVVSGRRLLVVEQVPDLVLTGYVCRECERPIQWKVSTLKLGAAGK